MPLRVRPATKEDLPALGRMGAGLVRFHHALDPRRFMLPGGDLEAGYARWLGGEAEKADALVLVVQAPDGAVVGYAYGRVEGRDWNALRDRCGMLYDVWVEAPHRRSGAGRALCEAVQVRFGALGAPRVVLMSATGNEAAQTLFARLGWRPTMVEMTCELPGSSEDT